MKQNKKANKKSPVKNADDLEKNQSKTHSEVREGQENSSILHDENEDNTELHRDVRKPDNKSGNQEEFIGEF